MTGKTLLLGNREIRLEINSILEGSHESDLIT
jgi:hypothetical protein